MYKATLPEWGGYDMVAYAKTEAKATRLVQQEYYNFVEDNEDAMTWVRAQEYYCFRCEVIETDVVIYE